MRRIIAIENEEGHYDLEVTMTREFSWRYRSLFGVEGRWNGDTRQFTIRIVFVGVTVGITGGITVGADG